MNSAILFIHGMFTTPRFWQPWVHFFSLRGYHCLAPSWPFHDGEPAQLRERGVPGLGDLRLDAVIETFADYATRLGPERPVIIGHSLGGLIAQVLISRGLGRAAVCISSMAPNRMLSLDWHILRAGAAMVNPLAGDPVYLPSPAFFREAFANRLTDAEADALYREHVVPESRNILRDALGRSGQLDLTRPHAPMLFVGGTRDHVVPEKLNKRLVDAYSDPESVTDFHEFDGRGHLICHEPGWQTVAAFVESWLTARVAGQAPIGFMIR